MRILKKLGYLMLLISSPSYSQSITHGLRMLYWQLEHEASYEKGTASKEHQDLLLPRLAFETHNLTGYIELKNKFTHSNRFSGYKLKVKSKKHNLKIKAYGNANSRLSEVSFTHTLKARRFSWFSIDLESELAVKLPGNATKIFVTPVVNWSHSQDKHKVSFSIKPEFLPFSEHCPNGKSYCINEVEASWRYDYLLSDKVQLGAEVELTKGFITEETEKKWLFSVRLYF